MPTIDNLDMSVHNAYAQRETLIREITKQFRLEEAPTIPVHTYVQSINLLPSHMDMLMGVVTVLTPWAHFFPPKKFNEVRRTPFTFSKIAPSLKDTEEDSELFNVVVGVNCNTDEEKKEKETILELFKVLNKLTRMLLEIGGKIGQFLQG